MVYCHVNIEARDERAGQREREASPLRMINYAGRREKLIPRLSLGGKKRCLPWMGPNEHARRPVCLWSRGGEVAEIIQIGGIALLPVNNDWSPS